MKWVGVVVVGVLLATTWTVAAATGAFGCSCSPPTARSALDRANEDPANTLVFLGEALTANEAGTNRFGEERHELTMRVDRVYAGEYAGDEIEVMHEMTCGRQPFPGPGVTAVSAFRFEDDWTLHSCGGSDLGQALVESIVDGLPEPTATGPPAFIVGHHLEGSLLATLDATGHVISFGAPLHESADQLPVQQVSVCPGKDSIALVASGRRTREGDMPVLHEFEVRDIANLDVVSTAATEFAKIPGVWPLDTISSFECHEPNGELLTGLARIDSSYAFPAAAQSGPGAVIVVEDGVVRSFEVPASRSMAVDADTRQAYVLTEDGRAVETWDIDDGTHTGTAALPGTTVGWHIRLAAGDTVHVLARRAAPAEGPDIFPRIQLLLSGPLDDLEVFELGTAGGLIEVRPSDDGAVALLRNPNEVILLQDDATWQVESLGSDELRHVAVGDERTFVIPVNAGALYNFHEDVGAATPLLELGPVHDILSVITGGEVIAQPPPRDIAERSLEAELDTNRHPVATTTETDRGPLVLAAVAAMAIIVAFIAASRRRRGRVRRSE